MADDEPMEEAPAAEVEVQEMSVLDALKDIKACLNNDFSNYKRAFHHCRSIVPDAEQVRPPPRRPFRASFFSQPLLSSIFFVRPLPLFLDRAK